MRSRIRRQEPDWRDVNRSGGERQADAQRGDHQVCFRIVAIDERLIPGVERFHHWDADTDDNDRRTEEPPEAHVRSVASGNGDATRSSTIASRVQFHDSFMPAQLYRRRPPPTRAPPPPR